jgi:putative membrane protein
VADRRGDAGIRAGVKTLDLDSRARTHLANERTFLAWLRTGLSLVAVGLATAQFLGRAGTDDFPVATVLAVLLVAGGTVMSAVGGWRFVRSGRAIEDGTFVPRTGAIVFAVAFAALAGVVSLFFVAMRR